ncbi:MAG: hypothetical protein HYZ28_19710 [Myxococcales bacterium]|nr:hypothetical protein [Myxococcales bacterium]
MRAHNRWVLGGVLFLAGCGESELRSVSDEQSTAESSLSVSQKRERSAIIKRAALSRGITNALLVAGIAHHESGLAQCWAEATWSCQGPHSPDCGGPVLAGSADGPCSWQQGGLGMFQLDSGTYWQTLAAHGQDVVRVAGNTRAGVEIIIEKVRVCPNTPRFGSREEVLDFINRALPGTSEYESFITAMAWCYNGCAPGYTSCSHSATRSAYQAGVNYLLNAFGYDYWYAPAPADGWELQGGRVAQNSDGRMEVFARFEDGSLRHTWQEEPSGGWGEWGYHGGALPAQPTAGRNQDGRLEALHVGHDGALYTRFQLAPSGGWSGDFLALGGEELTGELALGQNQDGRLEVFARTAEGALFHQWQVEPNGGWSGWRFMGAHTLHPPAVARNQDGRLEVFVRGLDDGMWHSWQLEPSGGWSEWRSLGGVLASAPSAALDGAGSLSAFHLGTDGRLYVRTQADWGWTGWEAIGSRKVASLAVAAQNADGRLEVFVRGEDGSLLHAWQHWPGSGFGELYSLGGFITSPPAVGRNSDGRLEAFARGGDGALWHLWQMEPSGGWGGWASLGGSLDGF